MSEDHFGRAGFGSISLLSGFHDMTTCRTAGSEALQSPWICFKKLLFHSRHEKTPPLDLDSGREIRAEVRRLSIDAATPLIADPRDAEMLLDRFRTHFRSAVQEATSGPCTTILDRDPKQKSSHFMEDELHRASRLAEKDSPRALARRGGVRLVKIKRNKYEVHF